MDIYSASHGGVVQVEQHLGDYVSLQDLFEDIAPQTGVEVQDILLFMEDGRELRQQILEEIYARGGEAGPSTPSRETLYLFDKRSFSADPHEWAASLHEEVQLPPQLNLSALNDLTSAQTPFLIAQDHILHLQSLSTTQSKALSIAYQNLLHHTSHLRQTFSTFAKTAEARLDTQEQLIKSAKGDMAMLNKVVVNEGIMRAKDKVGLEEGGKRSMGYWVNVKKMEQVREVCTATHEDQVERFNEVATQIEDLLVQSDSERVVSEERSLTLEHEFADALSRIEMALQQVETLLATRTEGVYEDLLELDQAMRDDLITLTDVKNEFTHDVHVYLNQVVLLQGRIPAIAPMIQILEQDLASSDPLRTNTSFNHLHRLHKLPLAYASTIVEVVRRKDFSTFLIEWTGKFLEVISRFTENEKTRRKDESGETWGLLPWNIASTMGDENAGPRLDMTVLGGAESLSGIKLDHGDVTDLVKWAESLRDDPDIMAAVEEGDLSPVEYLQSGLDALISGMSPKVAELNRMIEDSVLLNRTKSSLDLQAVQSLSSQLRAAERDQAQQTLHQVEAENAHKSYIRQLTDQHEQRTAVLQARQAELQEELLRLRSDLSDEMIVRQTLSTQLEEQSRDQQDRQREYDDQAELLLVIQAELVQEKDRATDLGVRLQEALLDVDGLRNAEQALVTQVQALQDDRSHSMRLLAEAHNDQQGLESQIAGLQAEMEAMSAQLSEARIERDAALRSQHAEAERMMRDHIAEADGDRAVLEHQNLTLTKQLEDLKVSSDEKLGAAKNAAIREVGGLQAELKLTKAQLRDVQRRETILADELAMARDNAVTMSSEKGYQSDVSRDAVALVTKYHEACQRLQTLINNSSTISGTASTMVQRPVTTVQAMSQSGDLRESVMIKSLETASGFDLGGFTESVQKTIGLVKKWSRSCKTYRDSAKNKISFAAFTKGDLALFLPTRNAVARSWAAFNIAAPHNFLKVNDAMQNQIGAREYIIARIISTEEAVAAGGESPINNPFGLADGLRYYVHHVEEYNPSAPPRPSRRSTSASYQPPTAPLETATSEILSSAHITRRENISIGSSTSPLRPRTMTSYFPTMPNASSSPETTHNVPSLTATGDDDSTPSNPTPKSHDQSIQADDIVTSPPALPGSFPIDLSPITESAPSPTRTILPSPASTAVLPPTSKSARLLSPTSPLQEPRASETRPETTSTGPPPLTPSPFLPSPAPVSQVRTHQRTHSHLTSTPTPTTERETPIFAPSSLGRPASVASSSAASSFPRHGTTPPGKSAPAMAITTSNSPGSVSGSRAGSTSALDVLGLGLERERRISRKGSNLSLLSVREELGVHKGLTVSPEETRPVRVEGFTAGMGTGTGTVKGGSGSGSGSGVGKGKVESVGGGSKLIRGFSIRKKAAVVDEGKATAMDMLRRFENGG